MSTLKTNNIQHVDRSDPSIIINTDGSVNIAGTMTYEDVTSVDAVGIITGRELINAQKQLHVGTGVSIAAGGLNVTAGITTVQALQAAADSTVNGITFGKGTGSTGDTNTAIRFGTDTFTVETAGSERVRIDSSGRILKGLTSARGNYGNNTSGVEYAIQLEGTSAIAAGLSIVRNSNDANDGGIVLGKTRATSNGGNTVVQAGDDLGNLTFAGSDGTSLLFGAEIFAEVQSGVGNDDLPTDLIFKTNGGTTSTTERVRITSAGLVSIPVAGNLQVGGAGSAETDSKIYVANTGGNAYIQIKGADSSGTVGLKFGRNSVANRAGIDWSASTDTLVFRTGGTDDRLSIESNGQVNIGGVAVSQNRNLNVASNSEANLAVETHNDAASESANIRFYKSRGTGASPTAVADNHYIGQLIFYGQDGTDYANTVGYMRVQVDGTVASNQIPGEIEFGINDGSSATRAMTIHKTGNVLFSGLTAKNDGRNAKGIALKSANGISFQTYGANGSRNWRIRPDDMAGWGTLEFAVSPTTNDATDWPDSSADIVLTLQGDKDVKINNGNLILTNTKGISFYNHGTGTNVDNNLLDDYEEGSAVPDFANADNSIITVNRYTYTKVGRLVHFEAKFTVGNNSDGSGFGFSLPFGQGGSRETVIPAISTRSGSTTTPFAFVVNANQSYAYAKQLDGFGTGNVEYVDFAGDIILVSGTYEST